MTDHSAHVAVYRSLTRMYPQSFRQGYGTDLVAVWSWQAVQPVPADVVVSGSWWKLLVAGPALAALTLGAMAVPWPDALDIGDGAYWLIVIAFMTSITLAASGVLLGIHAAVAHRRDASPA